MPEAATEELNVTSQDTDILGMSDEDFAALEGNYPESAAEPEEKTEGEDKDPALDEEDEIKDKALADSADDDPKTEDKSEDDGEDKLEKDPDSTDEGDQDDDAKPDESDDDKSPNEKDEADPDKKDAEKKKEDIDTGPNFEAEFKKLTSPFKANGKDMQIGNVDDAIKLMQMGANYNRKMAAMKPGLKALKMLEKNGLLDEDKLNYLIDLDKKNPAAITKLLKDSKLDVMEMDLEKDSDYKASDHTVGDPEVELDMVLSEIRDSDTYNQTLDVVSKQWDAKSKQIVADQPQLLKVINDHIASGVYDQISTEVEKERMFGRLSDVSDIEAYRTVGDALQAKGAFDAAGSKEPEPDALPKPKVKSATAVKNDQQRRDKRKAASLTKPAASSGKTLDLNPLALSDEEFMKQHDPSLL